MCSLIFKKLGLVIRAGQDLRLHTSCCCGTFLVLSVLRRWGVVVNASSSVCVCVYDGAQTLLLTPPAQAEAGVWMGARSSELIFTIMFVLQGASDRKHSGVVPVFALLLFSTFHCPTTPPSALGVSLFSF